MRRRRILLSGALLFALAAMAPTAALAKPKSGFKTSRPSMLTPVKPGTTVTPLMTVGDTLASGYRFEAIPDGISLDIRGHRRVNVFINHETGKVPFPWSATGGNTEANAENDFDNSQLSKLTLNRATAGTLRGRFVIVGPTHAIVLDQEATLSALAPQGVATLSVAWTPAAAGPHLVHFAIDPADEVPEVRECDHETMRPVEVAAAPGLVARGSTDRAAYGPRAPVRVAVVLASAGAAFAGRRA